MDAQASYPHTSEYLLSRHVEKRWPINPNRLGRTVRPRQSRRPPVAKGTMDVTLAQVM